MIRCFQVGLFTISIQACCLPSQAKPAPIALELSQDTLACIDDEVKGYKKRIDIVITVCSRILFFFSGVRYRNRDGMKKPHSEKCIKFMMKSKQPRIATYSLVANTILSHSIYIYRFCS
uniref:Putative secreted protein n=1 Tax=Anopheles darlingi TaxID=43151 RepID=A0A2M4D4K9_ANODA